MQYVLLAHEDMVVDLGLLVILEGGRNDEVTVRLGFHLLDLARWKSVINCYTIDMRTYQDGAVRAPRSQQ